ncbi:alcohol dehydrogenase catalytic domain-containing protein [Bifidobacterium mongoliense]|uniref:alcohol dehydrogenase catalytic domain-containing protein n=1 Tax=Bifidobacterium mongoliense TaxID=518643 RepID=UPI001ED9C1EA|nr:alcohol dehydrogenase catalytic domain-containing protein [Bifidobacterium mongoliense]
MESAGDVRVEDVDRPRIQRPTDAVIRLSAACICGSDLWGYRGAQPVGHQMMGHEYVGVVTEVGSAVRTVAVGDFVVGSFCLSDGTCEICEEGYPPAVRTAVSCPAPRPSTPVCRLRTAHWSRPPACPMRR